MKKINIIISLFLLQHTIFASQQSPCTKVQKYFTSLFIAADVELSRKILGDDEIICKAAESSSVYYIKYCLKHNIGDLNSKSEEGYTPLEIAKIVNNKEIIEIIENHLPKKVDSPRTITSQLSPVSSPTTSMKKYD